MKINVKDSLVNKFIETKEFNILIANIYNTYLEECRQSIDEFLIYKHQETDNPIYYSFLEVLDIDKDDYEFNNFSKAYHLKDIKLLDINEYQNNRYYQDIKIKDSKIGKWTLKYGTYLPYECFLYDELDIHDTSFYKEITKLGYFDKEFKYIEVLENDVTWMSITPHEINTMKDDIKKVSGNVLVLGLGLGYFPYMASLKDDVTSITIIEKDPNVIELFNSFIYKYFNKDKVKVVKADAFKYLDKSNEKFDYIYCDLYHNANDGLPLYIKTKHFEFKFKDTKFLYRIETSILALLRRYVILLFEENLEGLTFKDYQHYKNSEDKLINSLYKVVEKEIFSNREVVDNYLNEENLKKIASKIII